MGDGVLVYFGYPRAHEQCAGSRRRAPRRCGCASALPRARWS
jgi:class 3 adenylate cyclase